ncbi:MAG TPA: Crp/Fnr family transcriptional regulator [Bacteroidetes bacterium]|nr:Crp/Fnr family transcriptional regulator [Bacteroidota bacterium]
MGFDKTLDCSNCSLASSVFCHLEPDELDRIENSRIEVTYRPGETIIKNGTPNTHVISFNQGLAKVTLEGKNGKHFILDFIRPQSFFSGPGLFIDKKHHFTITAVESCKLCLIEMGTFLDIMKGNARMAFDYIENSNYFILNMANKMESLLVKHHHGRVAEALLYLSGKIYKSNPFDLSISKSDLSEMTGLSKESVSRILHEFTNEGLILVTGKTFHLLKEDLLEQISRNG